LIASATWFSKLAVVLTLITPVSTSHFTTSF
jgi:hypothetical protein